MKRFITFGSIEQYSSIVKKVKHTAQYEGIDENGNLIYNRHKKYPIIEAIGSEKIHGTNAAVCYSIPDGFWVQSRKNIITPEKDNAGCAFQAYNLKSEWLKIIEDLAVEYNIDLSKEIISVYFEWAGGNIQKNSACSGLEKRAIIFQHFKVSPIEPQHNASGEEISARWLETAVDNSTGDLLDEEAFRWVDNINKDIYNIMNFPTVTVKIDFNNPNDSINIMKELVHQIEKESLVGKLMGQECNIGEGYVFTFEYKNSMYRFKVKGEKHAKGSGKIKTLKPVDKALENKKRKFVNEIACQEFRLDQMFTEIQNSKYNGDIMQMSRQDIEDYLRLVFNDVIKEHSNEMASEGLEPKMVNGMISKVASSYFIDRFEKEQM
jgi:hypothetical protein